MGVACSRKGGKKSVYRFLLGKPEGKGPPGSQIVDGKIILIWIFRKWNVGTWNGSIWLRIGTGDEFLYMHLSAFRFYK
jgi:hypothetical protein